MHRLLKIKVPSDRIFGLDLLRALAILFVLIGHGNYLLPRGWGRHLDFLVFDGVAIFFVLSGYLIGNILIKKLQAPFTARSLLHFWIRRWFRTLPLYFAVLFLLCLFNYPFNSYFRSIPTWPYFFFAQNLAWPHPYFFSEAWSISVEEWFYLLMPLFVYVQLRIFRQSPKRVLLATAVLILLAVTFLRWYRYQQLQPLDAWLWDGVFRREVVTRLDTPMYGVLAAMLSFYYRRFWNHYKTPLFVAGIILHLSIRFLLPYATEPFGCFESVFSFSLSALATAMLLPLLSNYRKEQGWFFRFITRLSLISYSLYLLHFSIIQLVFLKGLQAFITLPPLANYALYWLLSALCATVTYRKFELPAMSIRDSKLFSRLNSVQSGNKFRSEGGA